MFDSVVTALLRAVLDEVCAGVSSHETGKKALLASRCWRARQRAS